MKQDKQPTTVARLPRFSHDLSFDRTWTSSTGHIIPVVHDFLNAGETIRCTIDLKTRMQPLLRPAMMDIHQKIKYFFVPMEMLYSLFGAIRYQVDDYFSTAFTSGENARKDGFPLYRFNNIGATVNFTQNYNKYAGKTKGFGQTDYDRFSGYFSYFDQWHQGAHRLLDAFMLNPDCVLASSETRDFNVFPYQLLAYQAVYFYYFRDDEWEQNYHYAYNCDFAYNSVQGFQEPALLTMRYVNRFKDYFTNVHMNPLLNAVGLLNGSDGGEYLSKANMWLYDSSSSDIRPAVMDDGLIPASGLDDSRTVGYVPFNNSDEQESQINASQLRLLFAVDKLLQVTGRAHKKVDDQILAHFGFKVPLDVKHNIQYLGEQDGSFGIGDVISTAETDSMVLGELAGKAFGRVSGSGVNKFTAPCDGVFLGVYYSMPKVRYTHGMAKFNAVTSRTDLFIPEFDHLGMQPLFQYESYFEESNPEIIQAWQWRYEQFKRRYNSVSAAFLKPYNNPAIVNPLQAWTPIMHPSRHVSYQFAYPNLKVTPHDLDNVMVMPFNSLFTPDGETGIPVDFVKQNPALFYQTDPFLHDMHVNYKKVSTMSTFSIPNLDNNV